MSTAAASAAEAPTTARANTSALTRADLAAASRIAAGCLAVGLVFGVAWGLWSPRGTGAAGYNPCADEVECAGYFAGQAYFGIGALLIGLLIGAVAYARRRDGGAALAIALAVGGLAGAVVAARTGIWIGHGPSAAALAALPLNTRYDAAVRLDAWGLVLVWPIASMFLTFWLALGATDHDDARRRAQPTGPEVGSRPTDLHG